jgi:IclR-like helix-turn-helix domain-containing protein
MLMTLSTATDSPCASIDFWGEIDGDVLQLLAKRPQGLSPAEIGHKLGVSEAGMRSVLAMLAQQGKIRMHGGTVNGTHA